MASVNSYLVDVGSGIVIIDAQRSLSSARRLVEQARQLSKPVLGIFLTHPHPDHFGGMTVLAKAFPDAPRYALQITQEAIQSDVGGYIALSQKALGEDFDPAIPIPDHRIAAGDHIVLGNTTFAADDAGVGEAPCMLMLSVPQENVLFCADVVQHNMTAFLLEGHSEAWLAQVETVAQKYGSVPMVYPGHGTEGAATELFAYQRQYLQTFRALMNENLTPDRKPQVVAGMERSYPGYLPVAAIPDLLEQDVDAVRKEMTAA